MKDRLSEPRTVIRDGVPLEWSELSRAMDEADDVMVSRGHRLGSYSNEEYAAAVRAALPPGCAICGTTDGESEADRHAWLHP